MLKVFFIPFFKVCNGLTTNKNKIMNSLKTLSLSFVLTLFFSCYNTAQVNTKQQAVIDAKPVEVPIQKGKARAYFC